MKRHILILALAGSALAAQAASAQGAAEADKQQVMNVLRDWVKAENEHDAAALRRILDDQFITTSGSSQPGNKEKFIKSLTAGKADPRQSQSLTDESVVVAGDTAVVVGTDTFHMTDGAKPDGLALRYTITFVRRGGHWTALAEHIVKMGN
jgi:ketosteroid isomerase-like protein